MTWLPGLAAALAVAIVSLAHLRALRAQQRAHARREDLLIDQILHLTGKPWHDPPANDREEQPEPVAVPRRYTATPEQYP